MSLKVIMGILVYRESVSVKKRSVFANMLINHKIYTVMYRI